jgi:oligo-alginate lyase
MNSFDTLSRRSLIKLVALASPALYGSGGLLADAEAGGAASDWLGQADHAGPASSERMLRRPRLFYNVESLRRMRQMLAADSGADVALKKRGEELLSAELIPESVAMIGGGQQAHYAKPGNQISEMGLTLGLLFQLTGDQRYAEKLREALLYYTHYVRWAGPELAERIPPWHSELDTTTFSFGYAAGYDALHGYLSEADRKTIAEGMVRLAVLPTLDDWLLPGTRVHAFDSMGHNWWGVCVAGGGLCALALLGDDPRAQRWIDAVDAGYAQWFNYPGNVLQNRMPTFERSGPSYEGVNYSNYGVSEYLHYRFAWQNTFGRRAATMEPLGHLATFFLQTLYPTKNGFLAANFDDSTLHVDSTATILLLIACGLGTEDAGRYLKDVHTHPEGTLLTLLRQHAMPAAQGDAGAAIIYPHMGWATMRSSWEDDAVFVAMKSGYTWNHAHPDAGTFVLFKDGMPLIIDSGTCSYGRPEYTTYYRQSRAHNVVLFNGEGQPQEDLDRGCKFPGSMHCLIDGLGMKYVYADATGPMARWFARNYRHWLWSGDVLLVIDDVLAHTAGRTDWLLHYEGEYSVGAEGAIRLKNGAAEAVVKMLYPANKYHEEIGLVDHDPDRKIPYLVFMPGDEVRSREFFTAICMDSDDVPQFEVLQGENYVGVRVRTQDAAEETYLNLRAINGSIHMNSAVWVGEWMTDAYLLHVRRLVAGDGTVERFFVSDASYVRKGQTSVMESLTKVTAGWMPGERMEIVSSDMRPPVQFGAAQAPREVRWNGRPVATVYDRERQLVTLRT